MNFALDLVTTGLLLELAVLNTVINNWIQLKAGDLLILGVIITSTRRTVYCVLQECGALGSLLPRHFSGGSYSFAVHSFTNIV